MAKIFDWIRNPSTKTLAPAPLALRGAGAPPVLPPRASVPDSPLGLIAVYRAVQVISTAVAQLPLKVEREGLEVPASQIPGLIKSPSLTLTRSDFLEQITLSLALNGNAYLYALKAKNSRVVELQVWNPVEVQPLQDPSTGVITYERAGKTYTRADVQHLTLMRIPGRLTGLGPIQAARRELSGAQDIRDYANAWFKGSGQPAGVLSTDQPLTGEDARLYRNAWNGLDENGETIENSANPSGVKVLGKGMSYDPIILKPEEAQWVSARQYTVTEIARLFGIPSTLLLAPLDGSAMTYSNVEQDWIGFLRFTLSQYLRKIEDALTVFLPRGQKARFNIDALLRSDTLTRYQAHKIALEAGFMTIEEIRAIESLPLLKENINV